MAEGLFGSNVGKKAPIIPRPTGVAPGQPLRLSTSAGRAAPKIHVSALHASAASLAMPGAPSTHSSTSTSWIKPAAPTPQSSGGGSVLGSIGGAVEGFIGHLGTDVVHTALGFPVGIAYMIEHPIAGAEGTVKATWHDWSPLFHGNVREWLHQTYEHPLAPILDVASVFTLGGAVAARGAALGASLADTADAAAKAADASVAAAGEAGVTRVNPLFRARGVSPAHPSFVSAEKAGEMVGKTGAAAKVADATTAGKLARFSKPTAYAYKTYASMAENLGYKASEVDAFARNAVRVDSGAKRLYAGSSGVTIARELSDNPWTRVRQAGLRKIGNSAADSSVGKGLHLDKVIGDQAAFKNWSRLDRGQRRAAMHNLIFHQLVAIHKVGEWLTNATFRDEINTLNPSMLKGMQFQAHEVSPIADLQAQADALKADKYQFMADPSHPDVQAAWEAVLQKHEARIAKAGDPVAVEAARAQAFKDVFHEDWSKTFTTDKPELALRDSKGNFRAVSRGEGKLQDELLNSHAVTKALYGNPTKVWRFLLLGLSPRYFVNNFVGNGIMLMAATDPVGLGLAFRQYVKMMHGGPALQGLDRVTAEAMGGAGPLRQLYGEEFGHSGTMIDPATGKVADNAPLTDKLLHKVPNAFGITHRLADKPYRYMALIYSMKRMPEYQAIYARLRAAGYSAEHAQVKAMETASESGAVRSIVRQNVNRISGQYHTYTKFERGIRNIVPFYAWDRHIATHFTDLMRRQPYKIAMGASIGSLGQLKTQQIMGNVPDFLQSAIPARLLQGPLGILGWMVGGNTNGRMGVLNAMTTSPYGSIGDLTQTAMGLTGMSKLRLGESLGAQINPLIQQAAQQLSGVDLTTGVPIKPGAGGPLAQAYLQAFGNVPQAKLLSALLGQEGPSTTSKGNPTLYEKNVQAALTSWLGLPVRQVNLDTAHALAKLQNPGPKKPRKRSLNFPGL